MDEVVGQSRLLAPAGESVRLPVGHMVCNQTPPVGDKPSLMTFRVSASSPLQDRGAKNPPGTLHAIFSFSIGATMYVHHHNIRVQAVAIIRQCDPSGCLMWHARCIEHTC